MPALTFLLFVVIGFAVGTIGTIVGAGGGFLIVPLLLLVFHVAPAAAAGTSLVAVTVTAVMATLAFARQGKVDWYGGLFLAAVGYPGTLAGAWAGARVNPRVFSAVFGVILFALATWMIVRTLRRARPRREAAPSPPPGAEARDESAAAADEGLAAPAGDPHPAMPAVARVGWRLCRHIRTDDAAAYSFCFPIPLGALLSFLIAFLGAMLGIGGGPLLVPAMIYALHYPIHIATATSPFIISLTAAAAAALHVASGHVLVDRAVALSIGSLAAGPTGALLNKRLKGNQIVLLLSSVLLLLGVRLVIRGLAG